jgi:hypothetical protein
MRKKKKRRKEVEIEVKSFYSFGGLYSDKKTYLFGWPKHRMKMRHVSISRLNETHWDDARSGDHQNKIH